MCFIHTHIYTHPLLFTRQQPFPHESLLMDRRELRLSRDEKRAAKKGYEEEKRASVPYTRPSYAHYYPASDQSLTNIPAFSQRNWSVTHLNKRVDRIYVSSPQLFIHESGESEGKLAKLRNFAGVLLRVQKRNP